MIKGTITNIQRYTIHDGPGIRSTVFFKGCPLRCLWCHNPETLLFERELFYNAKKCIGCGICVAGCPYNALTRASGSIDLNGQRCKRCFICAKNCPSSALDIRGQTIDSQELLQMLLPDLGFYQKGGGVTLSGGEPAAQPEFCMDVLKTLREAGIHTALDTSGHCASGPFETLCQNADLILFDLKAMDTDRHKTLCGVGNELILKNFRRILKAGLPLEIRIPLVSGLNDDAENMRGIAALLGETAFRGRVCFLGYHRLGLSKQVEFDSARGLRDAYAPTKERLDELKEILKTVMPSVNIIIR